MREKREINAKMKILVLSCLDGGKMKSNID